MAASSRTKKSSKFPSSLALNTEQQKEFESKVKEVRKKVQSGTKTGVIYVGHIPHGFFEPQLKSFFSQFGTVTRVRLARSKRTGGMKHYGYVEYLYEEVAKIAAETMNNYLMFDKLLKCEFVPSEKVHPQLFKGSNYRFTKPKAHLLAIDRHNKTKTEEEMKKSITRLEQRTRNKLNKLAEMGIEYSIDIDKAGGRFTTVKGRAKKQDGDETKTDDATPSKRRTSKRKVTASSENKSSKKTVPTSSKEEVSKAKSGATQRTKKTAERFAAKSKELKTGTTKRGALKGGKKTLKKARR